MDETRWTARDFLRAASELERMTPDHNAWTEEVLASNPPRLVRLQRLRALAKAFDIQPGFEALWSGEFISKRPLERYEPLRSRVLRDCEMHFPEVLRTARKPLELHDINSIYRHLFRFLSKYAYPMLGANGVVLAGSGFFLYPVYSIARTIDAIPEVVRPIEEVAGLVVDPDDRSFTERELAEHDWPDVNLRILELDWI